VRDDGGAADAADGAADGGHRVLVFAQLRGLLDIVARDVLQPAGVPFLRLDGGCAHACPPGAARPYCACTAGAPAPAGRHLCKWRLCARWALGCRRGAIVRRQASCGSAACAGRDDARGTRKRGGSARRACTRAAGACSGDA